MAVNLASTPRKVGERQILAQERNPKRKVMPNT